jgi:large subunit ribosomal protein L19
MSVLEKIEKEQLRHELAFNPGDQVRVHVKIVEGDKERIQVFEGVVISVHRGGNRASFTVRKMSYGVGVERIFPVHAPAVDKVEVVSSGRVRRGRLYYLRDLAGKAARLKEREEVDVVEGAVPPGTTPTAEA